jgi:hypothetical protein
VVGVVFSVGGGSLRDLKIGTRVDSRVWIEEVRTERQDDEYGTRVDVVKGEAALEEPKTLAL